MVRMTESILLTVKKMLGIAEEYHAFDIDIITNINAVFLTLNQLGIGPSVPFQIAGDDENWSDFVSPQEYPGIQTYVYMRTRIMFDPPTNSFLLDSMKAQCAEFEWRLMTQSEWYRYKSETEPSEPPTTNPEEPDEGETTPPDADESESEAVRRLVGEEAFRKRVVRRNRNQNGRKRV